MDINEYNNNRFQSIYDMLGDSVVRGIVFSVYDKYGPQNLYSFPPPVEQRKDGFGLPREERIRKKIEKYKANLDNAYNSVDNAAEIEKGADDGDSDNNKVLQNFTKRDYLQIAIKSVSLLIGEKIFEKDESLLDMSFFGVLPYPDMDICAQTYFKFYAQKLNDAVEPRACTFSLLVDNNKRSYIYDNIDFLKQVIRETVEKLVVFLIEGRWDPDEPDAELVSRIHDIIFDFFMKLKLAEERPFTPVASKRQIKMVFTGLQNSGKTSFLLTINRKYSELVRRDSTESQDVHIANMLGTTIVNWDVGGPDIDGRTFTNRAEVYLYDANLIYYFVDGTDRDHLQESKRWFGTILRNLKDLGINIPIIVIISKVDKDLTARPAIRNLIGEIRADFSAIALKYMKNFKFFETSIFELSSILTAFSNGITMLSPNKDIAQYKLKEYSRLLNASAILLFNENGLVISEYCSDPDFDIKHQYALRHVFETLGPQYIGILKNLETEQEEVSEMPGDLHKNDQIQDLVFETNLSDDSKILLKKIDISDFPVYLIMFLKQPAPKKEKIEEYLYKLAEEFKDILQVYII